MRGKEVGKEGLPKSGEGPSAGTRTMAKIINMIFRITKRILGIMNQIIGIVNPIIGKIGLIYGIFGLRLLGASK